MPCLPSPSRHVEITPASRQQKLPSSLPLLTLDVMHHRVLTGDNADNPWEIKTVRGGRHDLDRGFFFFFTCGYDSWFCQHTWHTYVCAGRLRRANSTASREIEFVLKMRWNFNDPAGKLGRLQWWHTVVYFIKGRKEYGKRGVCYMEIWVTERMCQNVSLTQMWRFAFRIGGNTMKLTHQIRHYDNYSEWRQPKRCNTF